MLQYKVVEITIVTDEAIESEINARTRQGWRFDCVSFAMRDASKRPAMAFVFFTKEVIE